MKQRFLVNSAIGVAIQTVYVDAGNGNDVNGDGTLTMPFKSLQKAVEYVRSQPFVKRHYDIILLTDVNLSSRLSIYKSLHSITITGGKSLYCAEQIMSYTESEDYVSFTCSEKPYSIIIDGKVKRVSESCDVHYPLDFYHDTESSMDGDEFRIKKPGGFPESLSGNEFIWFYQKWCCDYADVIRNDSDYIYVDPALINSYAKGESKDDEQYFRLMNCPQHLKRGNFFFTYSAADSQYHVTYYKEEGQGSISFVGVPKDAEVISLWNASNVKIKDLKIVGSALQKIMDGQAFSNAKGAITMTRCSNITVESVEFEGTDGYCVCVDKGSHRIEVKGCYMHNLLGGGVSIAGTSDQNSHITVEGNLIKTIGLYHASSVGVLIKTSIYNKVIHNTICDTFYSGMSVGWTWGYGTSNCDYNYIAYNHIHHCMQHVLSDGGGIYTLGKQPNSVIEYNKIHDIYGRKPTGSASGCIYTDEGSSGILIRYNTLFSASRCNFQNYGECNIFFNNILAYPTETVIHVSNNETGRVQNITIRNIIDSTVKLFTANFSDNKSVMMDNFLTDRCPDFLETDTIRDNYVVPISFRNSSDGDFFITEDTKSDNYTRVTSKTSACSTFTYAAMNNAAYGVTDSSLKEKAVLNDTFTLNGESNIPYVNYYKRLAKNITGASNPYLDNN